MWRFALIGLAACSSVFGIATEHEPDAPGAPIDGGLDAPDATTNGCSLIEHFDSSSLDTSTWRQVMPTSTVTVSVAGNEVHELVDGSTVGDYNGIITIHNFALAGFRVGARLSPLTTLNAETVLEIASDASNSVSAHSSGTSVTIAIKVAGVVTSNELPASDPYWGLAFSGTLLHFDTSADGITWVTQMSQQLSDRFPLTDLTVSVQSGSFAASSGGSATVDDVTICPI